jgi:hypothetical protein
MKANSEEFRLMEAAREKCPWARQVESRNAFLYGWEAAVEYLNFNARCRRAAIGDEVVIGGKVYIRAGGFKEVSGGRNLPVFIAEGPPDELEIPGD